MGEVVDFTAYKIAVDRATGQDKTAVTAGFEGFCYPMSETQEVKEFFAGLGFGLHEDFIAKYFPGETDGERKP